MPLKLNRTGLAFAHVWSEVLRDIGAWWPARLTSAFSRRLPGTGPSANHPTPPLPAGPANGGFAETLTLAETTGNRRKPVIQGDPTPA